MKIAFIVNQFPVFSETFILNQITGLLDRGHEVDIYAYGAPNQPGAHRDVDRYELLRRTTYLPSYPSNKAYRLIRGLRPLVINLQKKPVVVLRALNVFKFGRDAASLRILYQITPFLKNDGYDIVHCHFGPLGNLGILLKSVGAFHGQIVTTFRGYDISKSIKEEGDHIYDRLFKQASLVLCVSETIKDILIKLGCEQRKVVVHRSGVHLGELHFKPRIPKVNRNLKLLTVARLIEKKGVQYGIESVAKLLRNYPNLEYKIAGDGDLKHTLQELIKELKVDNSIKILGWQRKDRIMELLQEADIFLAPSVTGQDGDREGIPGAIVEALACGLPVISTRHAGIPEVVHDGQSGFLVPERDTNALAEKLQYLIEHPELWPDMGRKGRAYVEEHYDIDKLNDRLVGLYQQLIHDHRTPSALIDTPPR